VTKESQEPKIEVVSSCAALTDAVKCDLAKESDSKKCYHNGSACVVVPVAGACVNLVKNDCEKQINCAYDASKKCQEVATNCNNIKDATACGAITGLCLWNPTAAAGSQCETDKSGATAVNTTIYKWKKIALPAGKADEVTHFTVSKDNSHMYLYTTDAAGSPGLYWSDDNGAAWNKFANPIMLFLIGQPILSKI
jgi:hypothetical protein